MARTPIVTRESVPESDRSIYDDIVRERGGVPTEGPGSVMLNAPQVARRALDLAGFLRGLTSLEPRIRELAMLLAARENDCQYIWNAHAPPARAAGLKDEFVDALRDKSDLIGLSPDESAVVNYGREFFRTHRVSQQNFDAALEQFGRNGLTELTTLLGCYAMLAFNVNAFGAELPADHVEPELPV